MKVIISFVYAVYSIYLSNWSGINSPELSLLPLAVLPPPPAFFKCCWSLWNVPYHTCSLLILVFLQCFNCNYIIHWRYYKIIFSQWKSFSQTYISPILLAGSKGSVPLMTELCFGARKLPLAQAPDSLFQLHFLLDFFTDTWFWAVPATYLFYFI